jgi:hypothetical protein
VIVKPSKGELGLVVERLTPCPAPSVTAVEFNPLKGKLPNTEQDPEVESVCIETNCAESFVLIDKLPLVNVYVKNLMLFIL